MMNLVEEAADPELRRLLADPTRSYPPLQRRRVSQPDMPADP
jgi:hypothetical protein